MSESEKKQINEYIYFDDQEISSILAQIKNGYPSKLTSTVGDSKTNKKGHSVSTDTKGSAKLKIPLTSEGQIQSGISGKHEHIVGNSNLNQSAVDSVYEDYALNVIENELNDRLLDNIRNRKIKEGALVKFRSQFNILDLKKIKRFI
ncbi:DUF6414 family protein [Apilactobacillus ozensis]|uniref:DUF6414 family protein n=1 Tax=Apilactobacillus ozensis TaxID=866801 RepID=UPI0006D01151|nr:hypothetical protein [Apilactobacillus ozensis]